MVEIHISQAGGRIPKSRIEYLDYSWNFISGCRHYLTGICGGDGSQFNCWAKSITERFKAHYEYGFEPTLYPNKLLQPLTLKNPARIGVGFMGDLFGEWVDPELYVNFPPGSDNIVWLRGAVLNTIEACPQHTFLFLTKNPAGYQKWGEFPDNCWLGATVNNQEMLYDSLLELSKAKAKNKWLSIEPLLESLNGGECEGKRLDGLKNAGISWVVIGGYSGGRKSPPPAAICEIGEACDKAGIPLWLKDNLKPLIFSDRLFAEGWLNWAGEIRHDFPH